MMTPELTPSQEFQLMREYDITWPLRDDFSELVRKWSNILLLTDRHRSKREGVDFYVDFEINDTRAHDQLIVTNWINRNFCCISGWGLFQLLPWWKNMHAYFERQGLRSWLPYPCLLISGPTLARHHDPGRPTALNYPIFGEELTQGYFWPDKTVPDEKYIAKYNYRRGKTLLMNTTAIHGGLPTTKATGVPQLRAIFNMGFHQDLEQCHLALKDATANEIFGQ